ncbi:MAG: hypothetical protein IKO72_13785 [Kiritimatiellae bacterium]|nr:hypothetical protein [Kiritimatiellia bacterium]
MNPYFVPASGATPRSNGRRIVSACLCAILATALSAAAGDLPTMPINLDFKDGTKGWNIYGKWKIEDGVGRKGSKCLVWENTDPKTYAFPVQRIALEGGGVYRFGCWVKVDKAQRNGKQAEPSVSLDWSDANGHWISAAYAHPVVGNEPGTDGWVRYEGTTSPLPNAAVKGNLLCYMAKGSTGRVRFDDFMFRPEPARMVDWVLSSAYHDTAAEGAVSFHAALYLNLVKHPRETFEPFFSYKAADGSMVLVPPDAMDAQSASVTLAVNRMAEGSHEVAFFLRNRADGRDLGRAACRFTRAPAVRRRVAFDRYRRTLVDGKLFLPLGMYASRITDEVISRYTNGVFNCIMPYSSPTREQLDAAYAAGIMVIYSVKDMIWGGRLIKGYETREKSLAAVRAKIEMVKDHPAILAWYVNDEAPESQIWPLREVNAMIHELDPEHPTWAVTDKPWHVRPFIGSYDCIGMDPYPIGNHRGGIEIAGGWAIEARAGFFDVIPMWHVPQTFNWNWYRRTEINPEFRFPTREELDSMFWQAIAAGANGLVPYAFHAMQKDLKGAEYDKAMGDVFAVMSAVKRREALILSDPGPSVTTEAKNLLCRTWTTCCGAKWILLSNANRTGLTATVKLGESFREAVPEAGVSAKLSAADVLTVELGPLASGFVKLVPGTCGNR